MTDGRNRCNSNDIVVVAIAGIFIAIDICNCKSLVQVSKEYIPNNRRAVLSVEAVGWRNQPELDIDCTGDVIEEEGSECNTN